MGQLLEIDTLQLQNVYLKGLLEKAAAETIDREVAERIQTVLTEELHHRVKNMLTMVTAIVRQSMRTADSLAIAERAIGARLMAMASAHDLLLRADWKTTRLTAVIFGAIEHHIASPGRIVVEGDQIEIIAAAIVPLTLVLNELCTNATKYGALSKEGGHVSLTWARDTKSITFRWIERGGPLVSKPGRMSFGSRLIQDALPRQLRGQGTLSFPASGVEYQLTVPTKNLATSA